MKFFTVGVIGKFKSLCYFYFSINCVVLYAIAFSTILGETKIIPVDNIFSSECNHPQSMLRNDRFDLKKLTFFHPEDIAVSARVLHTLENNKILNKTSNFLFSGSSITAMGYFQGFVDHLRSRYGYKINAINRGHGATDILYALFCIDFGTDPVDIIFAEFGHSDWTDSKQDAEALFRKFSCGPHWI